LYSEYFDAVMLSVKIVEPIKSAVNANGPKKPDVEKSLPFRIYV